MNHKEVQKSKEIFEAKCLIIQKWLLDRHLKAECEAHITMIGVDLYDIKYIVRIYRYNDINHKIKLIDTHLTAECISNDEYLKHSIYSAVYKLVLEGLEFKRSLDDLQNRT